MKIALNKKYCSINFNKTAFHIYMYILSPSKLIMWYYCAVNGESKKIVFTSGATEKITSGVATSDF
jgi:hypothetical protein